MTDYLSYTFKDSPEFVQTFDELPLWSAPFGLLLLKHITLKPGITAVDIGSGSGFPLMELAGRLGKTAKLYGVDPWANANTRARLKIKNYGYTNIEILECPADKIPLPDSSADLVVSNLGINNFDQPAVIFKECNRILKSDGKLALTTNINGHWKEFYDLFEQTLLQLGKNDLIKKLISHQEHRGNIQSLTNLFSENGFKTTRLFEETIEMRFADGSAFLNHHFVKPGWLGSWKELIPEDERMQIFSTLETNLNKTAAQKGELKLTVPMVFVEGVKI